MLFKGLEFRLKWVLKIIILNQFLIIWIEKQQYQEFVERYNYCKFRYAEVTKFYKRSNFMIFINLFSYYNIYDQQAKNSITICQKFEQQQKFSLEKSEQHHICGPKQLNSSFLTSKIQNIILKENKWEIMIEWQDESNNQNEKEDFVINQFRDIISNYSQSIVFNTFIKPYRIAKKNQCLKLFFSIRKFCSEIQNSWIAILKNQRKHQLNRLEVKYIQIQVMKFNICKKSKYFKILQILQCSIKRCGLDRKLRNKFR
ncbi:unnamed protein product [Paramecium octaurelia]|uniref:Uncharacterized protein n=1 Tax=Paramecium octaurelia TaxID=43137 RepID=A0A8S1SL56_PAROT|nr:unnamed protein product [Paramecium octaurelia]